MPGPATPLPSTQGVGSPLGRDERGEHRWPDQVDDPADGEGSDDDPGPDRQCHVPHRSPPRPDRPAVRARVAVGDPSGRPGTRPPDNVGMRLAKLRRRGGLPDVVLGPALTPDRTAVPVTGTGRSDVPPARLDTRWSLAPVGALPARDPPPHVRRRGLLAAAGNGPAQRPARAGRGPRHGCRTALPAAVRADARVHRSGCPGGRGSSRGPPTTCSAGPRRSCSCARACPGTATPSRARRSPTRAWLRCPTHAGGSTSARGWCTCPTAASTSPRTWALRTATAPMGRSRRDPSRS